MLRTSFLLLLSLLFYSNLYSQDDIDCSDCHEVEIKGVHLDAVECADCHSDIVDEDHEDTGVAKVNCLDCHDEYEASVEHDIHHKLKKKINGKPTCKKCHGNHTIISPARFKNPTKQYCGKCHTNGKILLAGSYHSTSISEETCFDCHDEEDYKPELSTSVHNPLSC
ncbi:MAG: cytochrome c3 family protein, partial [Melioribacteraceae bacterium]|nr:cytochrome c3 family protein [Melioribacteraceae bacterium]